MELVEGALGGLLLGGVITFFIQGWYQTRKDDRGEDQTQNQRITALEIKIASLESRMIDRKDVEEIVQQQLRPISEKISDLDKHQTEMNGKLTDLVIAFNSYIRASGQVHDNKLGTLP